MEQHPQPKVRWFHTRIIAYISLLSIISMMIIASEQGWLKDTVGYFLFSFMTVISGYVGFSSSIDYLTVKK